MANFEKNAQIHQIFCPPKFVSLKVVFAKLSCSFEYFLVKTLQIFLCDLLQNAQNEKFLFLFPLLYVKLCGPCVIPDIFQLYCHCFFFTFPTTASMSSFSTCLCFCGNNWNMWLKPAVGMQLKSRNNIQTDKCIFIVSKMRLDNILGRCSSYFSDFQWPFADCHWTKVVLSIIFD